MNRHGVSHRKFGRRTKHRLAMFFNLSRSLVIHESITTTLPKAKEIKPIVEKLITIGKNGDNLHSMRLLLKKLKGDRAIVQKIIKELAPKYKTREGGYLRVVKCGFRSGDAAPMATIQFVEPTTAS